MAGMDFMQPQYPTFDFDGFYGIGGSTQGVMRPNGVNAMGGMGMGANGVPNSIMKMGGPAGPANEGSGIMSMLFGNQETGQMGALAPTAQALTGLAGSFLGMKQYGMAKEAFKESKRQFNLNFDAQKKDYNNQLEDRQRSRVAAAGSESGKYRSVSEVLEKNGV